MFLVLVIWLESGLAVKFAAPYLLVVFIKYWVRLNVLLYTNIISVVTCVANKLSWTKHPVPIRRFHRLPSVIRAADKWHIRRQALISSFIDIQFFHFVTGLYPIKILHSIVFSHLVVVVGFTLADFLLFLKLFDCILWSFEVMWLYTIRILKTYQSVFLL